MRCVHKSLVLSSNFVGISLNWPSVLGIRFNIIFNKVSIRQASTEIMLLCAKSCVIMFGWCILLVSAVSVKCEKNKLCWYKVFTYCVWLLLQQYFKIHNFGLK